jgi:hypothetical protein
MGFVGILELLVVYCSGDYKDAFLGQHSWPGDTEKNRCASHVLIKKAAKGGFLGSGMGI